MDEELDEETPAPETVSLRYMGMVECTIARGVWEAWGVNNQDSVTWNESNDYMAEVTTEAAIELARYRHTEFEASLFGQIPERLRAALAGAPLLPPGVELGKP